MANSISEWLLEPSHRLFTMEIEQPLATLLSLHMTIKDELDKQNKEFDPFWVSSRGNPYIILAVDNEKETAAYIVGVKDKDNAST